MYNEQKNIGLFESYVWVAISVVLTIGFAGGVIFNKFHEGIKNFYTLIYGLLFLPFLIVTMLAITKYDNVCGKPDNNLAIISSLFPFSFIFLLGISLLELFPGWIRGFSNTIGMWCIILGGFKEFSYKLLNHNENHNENQPQNKDNNIILNKIYNNHIPLFNEITSYHIDSSGNLDLPGSLGNIILLNSSEDKKMLKKYIFIKELIGRLIWYILLSIITIFVAINNVLNSEKCINKNSDDSSEFKNYLSSKLDD